MSAIICSIALIPDDDDECGAVGEMIGKELDLGLNPDYHGGKPATNCLSYGMA
jgi:hypothetical protein